MCEGLWAPGGKWVSADFQRGFTKRDGDGNGDGDGHGLLSPCLTVGVSLAAADGGLRIPLGVSSTYSQLTPV